MKISIVFSLFLLIVFLGACENTPIQAQKDQSDKAKKEQVEWIPATIKSITVGKSKYEDLIKYWGKPSFKQEFTEDFEEEIPNFESKTELGYKNIEIDGLEPNIGVIIGDKTRTVLSITLNFDEMTKEEAIRIYGSDYYLVATGDDKCIIDSQKKGDETKLEYPIELVYPQKGMSILIRKDNTVMSVNYPDECREY
jgi:hypothetical protein